MIGQFDTPAGKSLLSEIRGLFEKGRVFRRNDVPFVFVCGGPINTNTMRKQFLDWSSRELPEIVTVLAEQAFRDTFFHDPPKTYNLGIFESLIADISDCVILFPESPGAYAEMGLFSAIANIGSKILVVNDIQYQAKDSFANLGPINTFNRQSFLNPALHVNANGPAAIDFSPIRERLKRLMDRKKRTSLPHRTYRELSKLEKFLIIMEIVNLLHVTTLFGLFQCVRAAFDTFKANEVKQLLSIMVGSKRIERLDGDFYVLAKGAKSGLEFDAANVQRMKSRVLLYYKKQIPDYYHLVVGKRA